MLLSEDKIIHLAHKYLSHEAYAEVTFERSPALFPQAAYDTTTADFDNFLSAFEKEILAHIQQQAPLDSKRMDFLDNTVTEACVTSCFEMDGGIHLTIEAPSSEPKAYRNCNTLREAIDQAMVDVKEKNDVGH